MRERVDEETGEVLEVDPEVVPQSSALARAHEAAAMDVQVATAQKIGRNVAVFQADLEKWATLNPEVAAACTYAKPVGGGEKVIGPSARFAELAIAAYRHVAVDVFIEEEAHGYVTVGAAARDLYRNVTIRKRVRRSVLKSDGKTRQASHLVQNHINAASSIALRNAAFTLIPKALWLPAWLKSREVAAGDAQTFEERLGKALTFWAGKGVTEAQILAHLGRPSVKELDTDDLIYLRQRWDDVRAGDVKMADAFPPLAPERPAAEEKAREAQDRIDGALAPATPAEEKAAPRRQPRRGARAPAPAVTEAVQERADAGDPEPDKGGPDGEGVIEVNL